MENSVYMDLWLTDKSKIFNKVNDLSKAYDKFQNKNKRIVKQMLYGDFNQNIIKKYIQMLRDEQKRIIKELLKEYRNIFKNIPCVIFLTGSLARSSNRINSDIDLTFLYPQEFFKIINPIEEEIAVFLAKIFKYKGRDRVHTMTIYLPLIKESNVEYLPEIRYLNSNEVNKIKYRENYEELIFQINNTSRSFEDFKKHIEKNIKIDKCPEWIYNFEIMYLNYKEYDICNLISKLDDKLLENESKDDNIIKIIKEYKTKLANCDSDNNIDIMISKIKKIYKNEPLSNIYEFLAILRRIVILDNKKIGMIDLFEYEKNRDINRLLKKEKKDFWKNIYKYYWRLMRIESIINDLGYDLSSHCISTVKKEELQKLYFEKFKEKDFFNKIYEDKKKIYDIIKKIIDRILEETENV